MGSILCFCCSLADRRLGSLWGLLGFLGLPLWAPKPQTSHSGLQSAIANWSFALGTELADGLSGPWRPGPWVSLQGLGWEWRLLRMSPLLTGSTSRGPRAMVHTCACVSVHMSTQSNAHTQTCANTHTRI